MNDEPFPDAASNGQEHGVDVNLKRDRLPAQLEEDYEQLQEIITMVEVPEEPFETENYPEATQVRRIAEVLMDAIGTHLPLRHRKIRYVYRDGMKSSGQTVLGKASKVGTKWREIADVEFLVQINHPLYQYLPPHRKIRTIDHELCHLTLDDDDEPAGRNHDIEEFNEIVRRWGLDPDQEDFGETLRQLDLFTDVSAEGDPDPEPAAA